MTNAFAAARQAVGEQDAAGDEPDAPSCTWTGVIAPGAGTLPEATPASAADSARTEKSPIGTLGNVTVPAAFVKPVSVVASGPGAVASDDACALSVTSALATTPAPTPGRPSP